MIVLMSNLKTTLKLILPIALVWFWVNQPALAQYHLRLAIAILILYLFFKLIGGSKTPLTAEIIVLSVALILIAAATGGLNSPFFFLLYFLLFAVALVFETIPTLIYALALACFWIKDLNSLAGALQVLSLLLFSALAIYFSKQRLNLLKSQKEVKVLEKEAVNHRHNLLKIAHLTSELLADNHLPLGKTDRDSLQTIHKTVKELLKENESN